MWQAEIIHPLSSSSSTSSSSLCISGDSRCGKTSVAFSFCINYAKRCLPSVYICLKNKFYEQFPLQIVESGGKWTIDSLKYIDMIYVESFEDAMRAAASLHCSSRPPHLIVVDDLSDLFNRHDIDEQSSMIKLLALVKDFQIYSTTALNIPVVSLFITTKHMCDALMKYRAIDCNISLSQECSNGTNERETVKVSKTLLRYPHTHHLLGSLKLKPHCRELSFHPII